MNYPFIDPEKDAVAKMHFIKFLTGARRICLTCQKPLLYTPNLGIITVAIARCCGKTYMHRWDQEITSPG